MNKADYEKNILNAPDFPKEGVIFKDISPLLENHLEEVIKDLSQGINWDNVDAVVGIESRGFILGSALALMNNKGFIKIRKKGKLPPPIVSEPYSLEYGEDIIEMKENTTQKNIVLVDDVLATGGTLKAALKLCERNNYNVEAIKMLIDLQFLNDLADKYPQLSSVLQYS